LSDLLVTFLQAAYLQMCLASLQCEVIIQHHRTEAEQALLLISYDAATVIFMFSLSQNQSCEGFFFFISNNILMKYLYWMLKELLNYCMSLYSNLQKEYSNVRILFYVKYS